MPTVLRVRGYRFHFYAGDREEPPHVHVEHGEGEAKFWLEPVRFERSRGFDRAAINAIRRLVEEHRDVLLEAWDEYFNE
jgi:hypothetical protein